MFLCCYSLPFDLININLSLCLIFMPNSSGFRLSGYLFHV